MDESSGRQTLLSVEFTGLCLVMVAAFCNVSVFYGFYHYLGTIGIPVAWRGFLVGLEPMSAFILRLFVLPWLHVRNAFSVMVASLVLLIIASCSYMGVVTVPAMIALRIVHGAAFVLLTSAAIALVVNFIPPEMSGRGFSVLSIATMIPYAVIPPLAEALHPYVRTDADIYAGVSIFALLAVLLLVALRRHIGGAVKGMDGVLLRRPTIFEIRDNLRLRAVAFLLAAGLLIYLAHATFFYFMKDLSLKTRSGDVGLFFTVCMVAMIAVRAVGGVLFDRMKKLTALRVGLALLIPCFVTLPHACRPAAFYLLAGVYGLCMGIVLPLTIALLFSASPPPLRGLNTNLNLFTLDVAYFLMPYLGGGLIAFGAGFEILFYTAAGYVVLALALVIILARTEGRQADREGSALR